MRVYTKIPWEERFLSKVALPSTDGCMEWMGGKANGGYGRFGVSEGDIRYAHRVAYEHWVGPIPEKKTLDHTCRNKGCVNPDHLEPVSIGENVQRHFALMTHCKSGRHEFTEENTITHHGRRSCRACANEVQRRRYYVNKVNDARHDL